MYMCMPYIPCTCTCMSTVGFGNLFSGCVVIGNATTLSICMDVLVRYVELSDAATRSNEDGRYIAEEEEMVEQKALTIVMCFLNSDIPPKVQVRHETATFYEPMYGAMSSAFVDQCSGWNGARSDKSFQHRLHRAPTLLPTRNACLPDSLHLLEKVRMRKRSARIFTRDGVSWLCMYLFHTS